MREVPGFKPEVESLFFNFFHFHHVILEEGIDRQRDGHGIPFASREDEDRGPIGMGIVHASHQA